MHPRKRCGLLLLLMSIVSSPAYSAVKGAADRPNIVFIFADDWGYGDLGIHGSTFCKTPRIDRMASEGIDFQNFTVNSPVCSPSRTAVMTGQFPARQCMHQHLAGVESNRERGMPDWLDPSVPMLPRMLQEAGYTTGHFGKWHLGSCADAPVEHVYGYDEFATFGGSKTNVVEVNGLASVDHSVDFIRRNKDKPFFVNLWLHETHLPHYPRKRFLKQFEYLDERAQVYAAVVAEVDDGVGRILDLLKELKIDEKTLVVFSSDNGPEYSGTEAQKIHKNRKDGGLGRYYSVGETGRLKGEKRSLYAGGIRVPFIVRWPGVVPAGKTDATSVMTAVDLFPTFLDVAGVELPEGYLPDGESVLSALKGEGLKRSKAIYWEWRGPKTREFVWPHLGIRDGPWKLITNKELGRTELYDLESDWAEKKDLAPDHPERVTKLTAKLDVWRSTLPTEPRVSCLSKTRK